MKNCQVGILVLPVQSEHRAVRIFFEKAKTSKKRGHLHPSTPRRQQDDREAGSCGRPACALWVGGRWGVLGAGATMFASVERLSVGVARGTRP